MSGDDRHERLLEAVQSARAKYEERQDSVQTAKDEYYAAVRRLHEAGMPLRDVATALGLSHQRVHQMIAESAGAKQKGLSRRAKKAAGTAGLVLVATAAALGVWSSVDRASHNPVPSASTTVAQASPSIGAKKQPVPEVFLHPRNGRILFVSPHTVPGGNCALDDLASFSISVVVDGHASGKNLIVTCRPKR